MNITDDLGIYRIPCETKTDEEIFQEYEPDIWSNREKFQLNENVFARAFREVNHLSYQNGLFYTRYGKATEELLGHEVWASVEAMGIKRNVGQTVQKLISVIKLASTVPSLKSDPNIIPFHNGDLHIGKDWELHEELSPCPYRLPVPLRVEIGNMPYFHKWLHDLFYKDDILTIQEYLGYCLVPSTKAQKALFLVGEGGAGKSVMGVVLEAILGGAVISVTNTQDFLEDKFKIPELEYKLVLYDDDLDNVALSGTGFYKKLITNTLSITADRKYGQPFTFTPYVKLVACCNEMLTSKFDNTEGFYRRLLPVIIKPKAEDFRPDLEFYDKIRGEAESIVQWAVLGLQRLINNNWVLHESRRSKEYLTVKKSIGNHLPEFMESVFTFSPDARVTSADIMYVYAVWCKKNAYDPRSKRNVQMWLADNAEHYKIRKSQNIRKGDRCLNGYYGMGIKKEWLVVSSDDIIIK